MVKDQILGIDPDEKVLHHIKRHPIGLIPIYIFGAIVGLVLFGAYAFFIANKDDFGIDGGGGFLTIILIGLLILTGLATFVAAHVYKQNELILTDENVIQILQFSLFNRQVSQLNLAKIQDVSVDQIGIIPSMFGYGTIDIETAGEASNFSFQYVTNPNVIAKEILEAHENYVEPKGKRRKGSI